MTTKRLTKLPPILYHYTSADAAVKILSSMSILFSHRDNFNDHFDVKFHDCNLKQDFDEKKFWRLLKEKNPALYQKQASEEKGNSVREQIHENLFKHLNELLARLRIFCLSVRWDCPSMWAHYAHGHTGVALGCDTGKKANQSNGLFSKKSRDMKVAYRKEVIFIDEEKAVELFSYFYPSPKKVEKFVHSNYVLPILYNKSLDWEYENEFRLLRLLKKDEALQDKFYRHENLPATQFAHIILGKDIHPHDEWLILKLAKEKGLITRVEKIVDFARDYSYKVKLLWENR